MSLTLKRLTNTQKSTWIINTKKGARKYRVLYTQKVPLTHDGVGGADEASRPSKVIQGLKEEEPLTTPRSE